QGVQAIYVIGCKGLIVFRRYERVRDLKPIVVWMADGIIMGALPEVFFRRVFERQLQCQLRADKLSRGWKEQQDTEDSQCQKRQTRITAFWWFHLNLIKGLRAGR